MPAHLLALDQPAASSSAGDSALRSAIVSVARHYLQLARTRTPAEMESLIWQVSSLDGADHGQSCAAFASLTLALGAQAAGQQSWVTGGGSYPWPLHRWADVRVQPNPASPDVVSMLADAQAHHRWHPLGDGYRPQPGDWVLFDGHVEVVTRFGRRRPVHRGRRLAAGADRERAQVPGSVRRRGGARLRQQRRPGPPGGPARRRPVRRPVRRPGGTRRSRECSRTCRMVRPPGRTIRLTAGTISSRRTCRGQRPSRRSSAWWRRGRSRRSSGTASRPR